MLKPEQIPIEVRAVLHKACDSGEPWNIADTLAAAINAWPGFEYKADAAFPAFGYGPEAITLPLPREISK